MADRIKMVFDVFGKITVGVLLSAAVFTTLFWGVDGTVQMSILWQILMVSALCSFGMLMFPSESEKELSKIGMLVRHWLYFLFVNVVVLGLGSLFGWFSFKNWRMVLLMESLIVLVYAAINLICYLGDHATAQNMNRRLAQKQNELEKTQK